MDASVNEASVSALLGRLVATGRMIKTGWGEYALAEGLKPHFLVRPGEEALGIGNGLTGRSYAIPTMHGGIEVIAPYIEQFFQFATEHPEMKFLVTKIGCSVAKFHTQDITSFCTGSSTYKCLSACRVLLYIR